jgi:hypothetical protein
MGQHAITMGRRKKIALVAHGTLRHGPAPGAVRPFVHS